METKLESVRRIGTGVSIIVFPVMLLLGFVLHPNLLSFGMITEATEWAAEWRGVFLFHFGHLLVLFAVPLIIVACVRFMGLLRGSWLGLIGGVLGVFGAFMLAVDKGSLTLVLTAFQELPESEFLGIYPALQSLLDKAGWLWITWLFALLLVGFVILLIGLIRERIIPRWQGVFAIIGLLVLANPDIEIISSVGAILICIGLIPVGIRELRGEL